MENSFTNNYDYKTPKNFQLQLHYNYSVIVLNYQLHNYICNWPQPLLV